MTNITQFNHLDSIEARTKMSTFGGNLSSNLIIISIHSIQDDHFVPA